MSHDDKKEGNAGTFHGLVVCGGASSRMGADKGLLVYHDRSQQYYAYEMLTTFCDRVFLSCNKNQSENILSGFGIIQDGQEYENIGPMAALLTAFSYYTEKGFLVIGCDYPFLTKQTLKSFISTLTEKTVAAAFYNQDNKYEPLLAWYSSACAPILKNYFERGEYSLQQFLRNINAERYQPQDPQAMKSVDTLEEFRQAKVFFENLKPESDD